MYASAPPMAACQGHDAFVGKQRMRLPAFGLLFLSAAWQVLQRGAAEALYALQAVGL